MHDLTNLSLIAETLANQNATEAELEAIYRLQAAIEEIELLTAELARFAAGDT